jgi:hypothetical protein
VKTSLLLTFERVLPAIALAPSARAIAYITKHNINRRTRGKRYQMQRESERDRQPQRGRKQSNKKKDKGGRKREAGEAGKGIE